MTGPSVVFGAIAKATRWEETEYGHTPSDRTKEWGFDDRKLVLPLCLQYLTPSKAFIAVLVKDLHTYNKNAFSSLGGLLRPWGHLGCSHVVDGLFHVVCLDDAGPKCLQGRL